MLVCPASWFAVALSPGASLRRLPSAVKRYGHARHKVNRCLVSGEHSISSPVHGREVHIVLRSRAETSSKLPTLFQ
jgi:hypothetical protein